MKEDFEERAEALGIYVEEKKRSVTNGRVIFSHFDISLEDFLIWLHHGEAFPGVGEKDMGGYILLWDMDQYSLVALKDGIVLDRLVTEYNHGQELRLNVEAMTSASFRSRPIFIKGETFNYSILSETNTSQNEQDVLAHQETFNTFKQIPEQPRIDLRNSASVRNLIYALREASDSGSQKASIAYWLLDRVTDSDGIWLTDAVFLKDRFFRRVNDQVGLLATIDPDKPFVVSDLMVLMFDIYGRLSISATVFKGGMVDDTFQEHVSVSDRAVTVGVKQDGRSLIPLIHLSR